MLITLRLDYESSIECDSEYYVQQQAVSKLGCFVLNLFSILNINR